MDKTEVADPPSEEKKFLTVRQAAFIGVGAMVGAGSFALLGAAGAVAGAAVWLSFLIAGAIAALQGYSYATGLADLHLHHPHPRAGLDRHAAGHRGTQRRPRLCLEADPGEPGPRPG